MTLHQSIYFTEIVRQRSFTRAAQHLHISQPALSKSVRMLEQEFEAEFIDRIAKDFSLTDSGVLFHEYAQKILSFVDSQTREIRQRIESAAGTLRIGIPPTSGSIYYHTLISRFRALYPDIDLQIMEVPSRQILSSLNEGQLDLGVVLEPVNRENYVVQRAVRSEIVAVVSQSHPLADEISVPVSRLRDEPILMISQDFMFSGLVEEMCREAGFTPRVVFESSQWDLLYEMALDGQGVAFFPRALINKHPRPEAVCLELREPHTPWTLSVAYRKGRFITTPMRLFLDMCKE